MVTTGGHPLTASREVQMTVDTGPVNRVRPTFSETVRSARKAKQISQTQLAERAGVSRVTVTRIERDQRVPGRLRRRQRRHGIVMDPTVKECPRPPPLGLPRRAALRNRPLDRTHLQPPPPTTRTRPTHPSRIRASVQPRSEGHRGPHEISFFDTCLVASALSKIAAGIPSTKSP